MEGKDVGVTEEEKMAEYGIIDIERHMNLFSDFVCCRSYIVLRKAVVPTDECKSAWEQIGYVGDFWHTYVTSEIMDEMARILVTAGFTNEDKVLFGYKRVYSPTDLPEIEPPSCTSWVGLPSLERRINEIIGTSPEENKNAILR